MWNIIIILLLLLVPYVVLKVFRVPSAMRGRIAIALVLCFTGLGHFVQTEGMVRLLPAWVPDREWVIYLTGIMEWLMAAGLLVPSLSRAAGMVLCVFMVAVFPANVYASIQRVEFGGHETGPAYLAIRLPLQVLLIGWTYWFAVRRRGMPRSAGEEEPGYGNTAAL
jgi:uncharacterized membrane protein